MFRKLFVLPVRDALLGLDRCLDSGLRGLAFVALGLFAGWWLYVPLHELLHAAACRVAGGQVSRLEIEALYGGALLARMFPFVVPASDYAGRLSGFNTRGSDLIYLATDLGPFVLTLFPGVWALRRAAAARRPLLFGVALPFALAPFLSLTGDAYEIGSILVTRLPPWAAPAVRELLRGDDLGKKVSTLAGMVGPVGAPWGGAALAVAIGVLWAFLTYGLGSAVARRLGQPAPESPRQTAAPLPT
ncbi:MAG TPA: hypothetical protein VGS07_29210 [Thermoanaerobaculia bacterium]|jgi:hypothetical protein|nr:hypothetical protein [Thermoanaerobaculia bacterium]